jgi:hypothetical protein
MCEVPDGTVDRGVGSGVRRPDRAAATRPDSSRSPLLSAYSAPQSQSHRLSSTSSPRQAACPVLDHTPSPLARACGQAPDMESRVWGQAVMVSEIESGESVRCSGYGVVVSVVDVLEDDICTQAACGVAAPRALSQGAPGNAGRASPSPRPSGGVSLRRGGTAKVRLERYA